MSNFACEHCEANIIDSPRGYVSGCEHYPLNDGKSAWDRTYRIQLSKGVDHGSAAYLADGYCRRYGATK